MEKPTAMEAFSKNNVLLSLTVTLWNPARLDRGQAQSLAQAATASPEAVSASRILVPPRMMQTVKQRARDLRTLFANATAPWMHDGSRVMAASKYMPFLKDFKQAKTKFLQEAMTFARLYAKFIDEPGVRATSDAQHYMGTLYNAKHYPTSSYVEKDFQVYLSALPFPSSRDWRLKGIDQEHEKAFEELRQEFTERIQQSEENVALYWEELFDYRVSLLAARLGPDSRLVTSTVDKLLELSHDISTQALDIPSRTLLAAEAYGLCTQIRSMQDSGDSGPDSEERAEMHRKMNDLADRVDLAASAVEREEEL